MKIFCLIDSLNSGGAQRQMCMLIKALSEKGAKITLCTYHDYGFYNEMLEGAEVDRIQIPKGPKLKRIINVRTVISDVAPDLVISYLATPNLLAELATLPSRKFSLIVSERNTFPDGLNLKIKLRLNMHRLADRIVTNSFAQQNFIADEMPFLKHKITTIHNCVDLDQFHPMETTGADGVVRIIVVGRFEPQKNPFNLLSAIELLKREEGLPEVIVEWYGNNFFEHGRPTGKSKTFISLQEEVYSRGLADHFKFYPQRKDIQSVYRRASVICVPSLWEGCSNVICEAMACGLPVLASRVGDNAVLIKDQLNGYLFDSHSPSDIAASISNFIRLDESEQLRMGREGRLRAEQMMSPALFTEKYLHIIQDLIDEKRSCGK